MEFDETTANMTFPDYGGGFQLFCTTCDELKKSMENISSVFCTCTEDPYDAVNVLKQVPELQLTLVTYALCMVAGVGGNVITLFTMATADRKNKTVTNVFLISLTIADLLLLFIAAPMELVHYFAREFDSEGSTCKVAEYSRVLSAVASILNLLAVTVERFIVIVFPMRSRSLCTMTNCRRCLVLVWGLSVILAAPVLLTKSVYKLHYGNNETLVTVSYCNDYDDRLGFAFTIYQLVAIFALPALIMIFCYSIVIRELWRSNKNMAILTNNASVRTRANLRIHYTAGERSPKSNGHPHNNAQKADDVRAARRQVIKMLIWVVFLFLVCWGPRFVMEMLLKMQFDWMFRPSIYWTRVGLFLLPFIHAILNPVIYFVMSRNFRASVMKKLTECTCRNNDQDDLFGASAAIVATPGRHGCDATPQETCMTRLSTFSASHRNGRVTRTSHKTSHVILAVVEPKKLCVTDRDVTGGSGGGDFVKLCDGNLVEIVKTSDEKKVCDANHVDIVKTCDGKKVCDANNREMCQSSGDKKVCDVTTNADNNKNNIPTNSLSEIKEESFRAQLEENT